MSRLYGMAASFFEGGLRLALWAIRESQKKIEKVEARTEIRVIEEILADSAVTLSDERRRGFEKRRRDLQEAASR